MRKDYALMLQLFADAAAGDTALSTGETEAVAAPPASGETDASAAGMQQDLKSEFDALIKGKYKPFFDERVQDILKKRLKETKAEAAYAPEAAEQPSAQENAEPAQETGEASSHTPALVTAQVEHWQSQAEALKQRYPNFSLREALADPRFARLLLGGAEMEAAYEVLNKDKLLPQTMAYTARLVEQKLAAGLRSRDNRPAENGTAGMAAAVVRQDVSQMTPADRAQIIRRVQKGEKIRF